MSDIREIVRDPKHRRRFEKLLYWTAKTGDAVLVEQRVGWGIDPNCQSNSGLTPMIANIRGRCPNAETVQVLLKAGADAKILDRAGLTALDYARRKLARLQNSRRRPPSKSPNLDENNQLQLLPDEQMELDEIRAMLVNSSSAKDYLRVWWKERLRAARRVFNDPREVEKIVEMLEGS